MYISYSVSARRELREYVRAYAEREVIHPEGDAVPPTIASLESVLRFDSFDPRMPYDCAGRGHSSQQMFISGARTGPAPRLQTNNRIRSFRVFFQPCGLWQLFRVPDSRITNQVFTAADILGADMDPLCLQLADCTTFDIRVKVVEQLLLSRAVHRSTRTRIMSIAVSMFTDPSDLCIEELAHLSDLGIRQFERRFADEMGMRPKLFGNIARFQMAVDLKLSCLKRSWLDIAHEVGFHDQMHMVRTFRRLGGDSPERVLMGLEDARPPALAARVDEMSNKA